MISAPAATTTTANSLADAVQAAAIAAEKKEKEKMKEIKLASKSSILASKKKMSNVLSMWKQRSHESQAPRDANLSTEEKSNTVSVTVTGGGVGKLKNEAAVSSVNTSVQSANLDAQKPVGVGGGTLRGVIRGSGRGVVKSDTTYVGSGSGSGSNNVASTTTSMEVNNSCAVPFMTDASALGSYTPPAATVSGRRRFSEAPVHGHVQSAMSGKEQQQQPQSGYRDRAAERRSLYGSSSFGDDVGVGDPSKRL